MGNILKKLTTIISAQRLKSPTGRGWGGSPENEFFQKT